MKEFQFIMTGPGVRDSVLFTTEDSRLADALRARIPDAIEAAAKIVGAPRPENFGRSEPVRILSSGDERFKPHQQFPSMMHLSLAFGYRYNAVQRELSVRAASTQPERFVRVDGKVLNEPDKFWSRKGELLKTKVVFCRESDYGDIADDMFGKV